MRYISSSFFCLFCCVAFLFSVDATADLIKLKNGGEIRGKVDWKKSSSKSATISITTMTGANVIVARKNIHFATHRSLIVEEYETLAKQIEQTVKSHWEMAGWCLKNKLKRQRKIHLEKIIELEPDHEQAQLGLGHSLREGKWMSRDEWMTSLGMVKYKNRYITPQELEVINQNKDEFEKEKAWFAKVRVWFKAMTSQNEKRRKMGYDNFASLTDPHAIPALSKVLGEHQQDSIREFFIKLLVKMEGIKPVRPLIQHALFDANKNLRYAALNGLSEDQHAAAMPLFLKELKNKNNIIVRRAAKGLERIGNEQAVPYLIKALITTHSYKIRVPKKGISFGTGGTGNVSSLSPEIEAMLRTGQFINGVIINRQDQTSNQLRPMKTITVKHSHHNAEVLSALQKITGQSFGYDGRTWRLWLTTSKNGSAN